MRLLLLTQRYLPHRGGLARSAHRIACGLKRRVAEVHVMVADDGLDPGDMESVDHDGLLVHRLGSFKQDDRTDMMLGMAVEILHRRHPFDALAGLYLVRAGFIASLEARLLGLPSLVLARGNDVDREIFRPSRHSFVMGALRMATAVGCVSLELKSKCRALHNRDGIHHTPNSVDAGDFTPGPPDEELRRTLGLGDTVIGFSGELRFKKGMHHLLMAAEQMAERFEGTKFLLLGGVRRDDRVEYRRCLEDNPGLKDILVETPYLEGSEELSRHYRLMDALFMPSFWEGMPNACLEAFACGVPAVASTAGGLKELVETGVTGYSFQPGDFSGAVEALSEMLSASREKRRAMGSNAREKVMREYTPEIEIGRILKIIEGKAEG